MTFQISVYCCREFIWRHLRYGTTAKAWDDNVKVDWKRRHKESFYPPQVAECGTRECKAGIDLGTEKTETGGRECNAITGWKPDWGGTEEQMEAEREKMGNWRLRMRHDLDQEQFMHNNTNKTRTPFYLKHWTVLISPLWCDVAPNRTKFGLMQ